MCFPAFAVLGFTVKVLLKSHVDTVTYRQDQSPQLTLEWLTIILQNYLLCDFFRWNVQKCSLSEIRLFFQKFLWLLPALQAQTPQSFILSLFIHTHESCYHLATNALFPPWSNALANPSLVCTRGVLPQSLNHSSLAWTELSPICPNPEMVVGKETPYHFLTLPANCGVMSPLHQHTSYGTCGIVCKAQLNESASLQKRHLWDFCHMHIYKLELNFQSSRGQHRGLLLFLALVFSAVLALGSFPQHHLLPAHCGFHRL